MGNNSGLSRRSVLSSLLAGGTATVLGVATADKSAYALSDYTAETKVRANWSIPFDPAATRPHWYPRDLPTPGEVIHEYNMEVLLTPHEILPLVQFPAYAYNGIVPGPELRVTEGDWIKVNLLNKTHDFHTIHWHGLEVECEMDGVPFSTQYPIGYNQTFQYLFRAQPAGTHFYHCHQMTNLHVQAGLYGVIIVESPDDPVRKQFPYTRDYTLVLSEVDTNFVEEQINSMQLMGAQMDYMSRSPAMMAKMSGEMMGWFASKDAFMAAIKSGWIPPYVSSMAGKFRQIQPNFFMINGKSYPMTEHISIRSGELIRVRLVGAGMMPHFMHLHGHDFWHVCQDGAPLQNPVRLNTVPVFPGTTSDIIIEGTNPGNWHFHDHSDLCLTNNGASPGGMMTMLMYEDAATAGFKFNEIITLNS